MKKLIKIAIASVLVLGFNAMAAGASNFGTGSKMPSTTTLLATGASNFGTGG
jgi:hypothetical protein